MISNSNERFAPAESLRLAIRCAAPLVVTMRPKNAIRFYAGDPHLACRCFCDSRPCGMTATRGDVATRQPLRWRDVCRDASRTKKRGAKVRNPEFHEQSQAWT